MNPLYVSIACVACFANDNDAFIPEVWAMEGLAILEENMVMARLVHRDFSNEVANFGDVVNTRRPGTFRTQRKTDSDSVSAQDASATNVRVPLDQHHYVTFVIKDGEASKSMKELIQIYLVPGMQTIARGIDRGLIGQVHKYLSTSDKRSGRLSNLSSANAKDFALEAREILNKNKAYVDGRNLVLAPSSETALLKTDLFIAANQRGDGGNALENATLGRILGFNTFMDVNVPAITTTNADIATGTITNALAAGGSGSQAATITGYNVNVGEYATVAGNDQPTHVTARTLNMADTTAITLNEANKYATGALAVVTVYKKCDVKGAYAAGYSKEIVVDGWTASKAPQVGQLISFGTGGSRHTYTIIESFLSAAGEQSILLDRPLDAALADNDLAFPGPAGAFNLAFHRDALALVSRPLARPNSQFGVMAGVASHNDVAMRVTMQYDSSVQGTRVTMDTLCGYAVLDTNLACVYLG
jgi:hypothetical protein